MRRWGNLLLCVGFGLLAAGCPKGEPDFTQGKKAEALQDYDAAFNFYQKAAKADPYNASYKIKLNRARFEASELHVKRGVELRNQGNLPGAASEFQRAQAIDPGSPIAEQELRKTVEVIAEKNREDAVRLMRQRNHRPIQTNSLWHRCRRKSSRSPERQSIIRRPATQK